MSEQLGFFLWAAKWMIAFLALGVTMAIMSIGAIVVTMWAIQLLRDLW